MLKLASKDSILNWNISNQANEEEMKSMESIVFYRAFSWAKDL